MAHLVGAVREPPTPIVACRGAPRRRSAADTMLPTSPAGATEFSPGRREASPGLPTSSNPEPPNGGERNVSRQGNAAADAKLATTRGGASPETHFPGYPRGTAQLLPRQMRCRATGFFVPFAPLRLSRIIAVRITASGSTLACCRPSCVISRPNPTPFRHEMALIPRKTCRTPCRIGLDSGGPCAL